MLTRGLHRLVLVKMPYCWKSHVLAHIYTAVRGVQKISPSGSSFVIIQQDSDH